MKKFSLPLLIAAGFLAACAPINVQMDYDPDVDFSRYATFNWMPEDPDHKERMPPSGPFMGKRIKKAVVEHLVARGYEKVSDAPDLLIAYRVHFKNKSYVDVAGYGYWGARPIGVRHYREGTLVIDLVDRERRELVWRGWSVSTLHPASNPQQEQRAVTKAVGEILKLFPTYVLVTKGESL